MGKFNKQTERKIDIAGSKPAHHVKADSTSSELPKAGGAVAPCHDSPPEQTSDARTLAGAESRAKDSPLLYQRTARTRPADPSGQVEPPGEFTTIFERDYAALPPGADLLSVLEGVKTAEDFSEYALDVLADFRGNAAAWNNACLHSFLDGVASSVSYLAWEAGQDGAAREPSWQLFAAILHAARFYGTEEFEEWVEELATHLFDSPLSSQQVQ